MCCLFPFPVLGRAGRGGLYFLLAVRGCSASLRPETSSVPPHPKVRGASAFSFWLSAAAGPFFVAGGNTLFPLQDNVQGAATIFLTSDGVWPTTLARNKLQPNPPCGKTWDTRLIVRARSPNLFFVVGDHKKFPC